MAAAVADYLRQKMLASSSSFACETVFSHPSKLDFMKRANTNGFKVYLYFIALQDPCINIERVSNRVCKGGHDVPKDKVISRFHRCMDNLLPAMKLCAKAYFFDNSEANEICGFNNFACLEDGEIAFFCDTVPAWFDTYVLQKITR